MIDSSYEIVRFTDVVKMPVDQQAKFGFVLEKNVHKYSLEAFLLFVKELNS